MLAGFGFIHREFKETQLEIKSDFKSFEKEIREDMKAQSQRSDQLYTMFIDLLKSKRGD